MSKNKKSTPPSSAKKTLAKPTSTERLHLKNPSHKITDNSNRPLSKLATEEQVLGTYGAQNRSMLNAREDSSTGATTQLPSEVEFRKRSNKGWDKIFDFSTNSTKEKMQNFMNTGVGFLCGSNSKNHDEKNTTSNMMTKLSNNIRHNFEQNIELGQEALKCKTAVDFIEFQRNHFETNYKNTVTLFNDLFYDIQNLTTQSINDIAKYAKD